MNKIASVGDSLTGHYPPIYYSRLRDFARRKWIGLGIISTLAFLAGDSFIWDWYNPLMLFAPLLGALWIYTVFVAIVASRDMAIACVLPYFSKKFPHVGADTFLSGAAIARNFQLLEKWAIDRGVTPLSSYGWADDLSGETVVWYEAGDGLVSVNALLQNPELADEVRIDLEKLQAAMQSAQALGTPFCLLLRHGNSVSGAEMYARQGTSF